MPSLKIAATKSDNASEVQANNPEPKPTLKLITENADQTKQAAKHLVKDNSKKVEEKKEEVVSNLQDTKEKKQFDDPKGNNVSKDKVLDEVDNQKEKTILKKSEVIVEQMIPTKPEQEAPKPKVAKEKVDPPLKVPAFNAGPHSRPPIESQKDVKIPSFKGGPGSFKSQIRKKENPRISYSHMKSSELPLKQIRVRMTMDNEKSETYYVMEEVDGLQDYLDYVSNSIVEHLKDDKTESYIPEEQEMVLANFENAYYRGVTLENKKDKGFLIHFVDYGNEAICQPKDIRPYTKKAGSDILLNEIYIENMPKPINQKAIDLLQDEKGVLINVKKKSEEFGVYVCDLVGL